MAKNLLIVESPAKAKTIEKFLGKDFSVKSCYGHIRDLDKANYGIDIKKGFAPKYIVPDEKKDVVKELKKFAKDVEEVWLATDEDREGEAISWHLTEVLGLDVKNTKRIVFHEITKNAIQKAVENPRLLDLNLVNAQQARRILDRLVGFEISPILWRKMSMRGTSAGRVQSVAVRLIVEREREIIAFHPESTFKVVAYFTFDKYTFKAELPTKYKTENDAENFLKKCVQAKFSVKTIEVKPGKKSPSAPFTTSTLQQEASRKLGYSVSKTMLMAQKLYEAGFITYMRTDSVNLSETAMNEASKEIEKSYGKKYAFPRQFKTKSKSAQEAHEAIRPTYIENREVKAAADELKLYELIWKRTIASQMSDAELEKTNVNISISNTNEELVASGEVIKFDGFLKVYFESSDDDMEDEDSTLLPPMEIGQNLNLNEINAVERFSRPPARYTEASLVKKLEELGIGRPSTFAPTISTVQKRGYVAKESREGVERKYNFLSLKNDKISKELKREITGAEKGKLFPTSAGMVVNDFLVTHFDNIMDYGFTAKIEEDFDEIAIGQKVWNNMIEEFYTPFHKTVEDTIKNAERITGERELGIEPKSGKKIYAKMGKYGAMIQVGEITDEEKPKFAKLRPGQMIETITFEEALELLQLPRTVGEWDGIPIVASEGRFGPYVQYDGKFFSLGKNFDPVHINLEEAKQLIEEKRKAQKEKVIKVFEKEGIQVLNGRYGPYINQGKTNARIPKDKTPSELTLEECQELLINAPASKRRGGKKKK